MASNGRWDGSTGGIEPAERKPDMVLQVDKRRLGKKEIVLLDMKDLLILSAERDAVLEKLRGYEPGVVAGTSLVASS